MHDSPTPCNLPGAVQGRSLSDSIKVIPRSSSSLQLQSYSYRGGQPMSGSHRLILQWGAHN